MLHPSFTRADVTPEIEVHATIKRWYSSFAGKPININNWLPHWLYQTMVSYLNLIYIRKDLEIFQKLNNRRSVQRCSIIYIRRKLRKTITGLCSPAANCRQGRIRYCLHSRTNTAALFRCNGYEQEETVINSAHSSPAGNLFAELICITLLVDD